MVREWKDYQEFHRTGVRRRIAELTEKALDRELTHEIIEEALTGVIPDLKGETVDNDDFHELVTVVYAEYIRGGAVDA